MLFQTILDCKEFWYKDQYYYVTSTYCYSDNYGTYKEINEMDYRLINIFHVKELQELLKRLQLL